MTDTHDHITGREYEVLLKKMAVGQKKYVDDDGNVTPRGYRQLDRQGQIEVALEEPIEDVLTGVMKSNKGKVRPSHKQINKRLEEAKHYDHEELGKVSIHTFYDWIDEHGLR